MACVYVPADPGYLRGTLDYIDCQAQTIGGQGYLALAAPGSAVSLALTALLTILIALYGYRLLLGESIGVRDGVLTLVKIGIVVALATGWSGYRTLFYDVVLHGPAELASTVGGASGLPGATGGLAAHLDATDQEFQALQVAGVGGPFPYGPQSGIAPPLFAGFDTFALGTSRVTFLVSAVGAFAAVRLTAGLLLALGPVFIALLLFEATRGLFVGWLRVLIGVALGALATSIALGVELALLEPWLADLLARRAADQPIPGVPAQLLAATFVFAIVLLVMLRAVAKVAWGLDLRTRWLAAAGGHSTSNTSERAQFARFEGRTATTIDGGRPRAAAIVDAVSASERREANYVQAGSSIQIRSGAGGSPPAGSPAATPGRAPAPAGGDRRRTSSRVSASAGRRDVAR